MESDAAQRSGRPRRARNRVRASAIPIRWPAWQLASWLLIGSLAGCGGESAGHALEGEVVLDGAPLAEGSLTLVPMQEGAGTPPLKILNGAFSCGPDHGVTEGTYRVEITAYEKTGRMVEDPDAIGGGMAEEMRPLIPAKYNRNSELTLEVPLPKDETLRFELESR